MIQASAICKTYGSKSNMVRALDLLDFEISAGQCVAIVGRSGSGKTTLLNILSGLDRPTSGELLVNNQDLAKLSSGAMAEYRLKTVGVIFQSFQLISQRTAAQNVELPLIIAGESAIDRRSKVKVALDKVGLTHRADHFPYQLSGGEQQRVSIARAIVKQPKVLLADEPTGNLDSKTTTEIMELLLSVAEQESLTLVLVTHDLDLAEKYSEKQFSMNDGQLSQIDLASQANQTHSFHESGAKAK